VCEEVILPMPFPAPYELNKEFVSKSTLKMLGLYLYTLIIGHKSCNILSILNKLKL